MFSPHSVTPDQPEGRAARGRSSLRREDQGQDMPPVFPSYAQHLLGKAAAWSSNFGETEKNDHLEVALGTKERYTFPHGSGK